MAGEFPYLWATQARGPVSTLARFASIAAGANLRKELSHDKTRHPRL
jgi:hypothetical protein